MSSAGKIPENPLEFIRECVSAGRILWTYHVNMRVRLRNISREQIIGAVSTFEVIESYPEDKYLPSYLVFCRSEGEILHVLFAVDVEDENVRIVTAYRPKPEEWELDLKCRRKP